MVTDDSERVMPQDDKELSVRDSARTARQTWLDRVLRIAAKAWCLCAAKAHCAKLAAMNAVAKGSLPSARSPASVLLALTFAASMQALVATSAALMCVLASLLAMRRAIRADPAELF